MSLNHNRKLALLILTSSFPSSTGDETCGYLRDFARCMSASFDVEVFAPYDELSVDRHVDVFKLTRLRRLLPLGLDSFQGSSDLNELASGNLLAKICSLPSLFWFFVHSFVRSLTADVICSHWLVPSGLAASIASRILCKPHIVIEHSGGLHLLSRTKAGRAIAKFIVGGSNRVVVVSTDLRLKLLQMCPDAAEKIEVAPMGIMTDPGSSSARPHCTEEPLARWQSHSPRTVLFIGRLVEIKGVDLLLTAMKGMKDVRLVVAGDGPARCELEARACELSVTALFVGRVGAIQREELLAACDVVVIPSRVLANGRTEGTPVVCLEALRACRVVVAARTGGLKDVIVDNQNGLLFEPGNHVMLGQKLMLGLENEELRRKVSANARLTAEAFDWARIGERFSNIFLNAIEPNAIENNGQSCDSRIQARDVCG